MKLTNASARPRVDAKRNTRMMATPLRKISEVPTAKLQLSSFIGHAVECRKALAYCHYPYYHPLAAHLSKNKDYEGTLGAIIFGVVTMVAASELLDLPGSYGMKVGFTVLAVVIGRLGDLFESLLKRAAGVKDSGTLIPGHGGVLDRIDALMFATIVFSRYYALQS
ncbi:hypothetical protein PF005_g15123 [Phytophthora fragariae]|uniref:Phosphatidate cytidylyltransferase n=1 Tax=Phytophthora fragariae TaxID=53985 RepID=A0A6A3YH59_9STRA|nr:hypothetical protein PF003_g12563 [Phytophthora fragariae]KAE8933550.1 hypothetical protein PF009_g16434 [Phytophthora fragariae]KAE9100579.1 hypothetical protein PF007_g15460 [Phytophthora fragariae]KAE9100737.1 hypothetical protein PF010_g14716 [Phytophthora fragariae]KAE9137221.1 hypothetical protein PF006_g14236 [Phytophthora fragariae]